MCFLGWLGECPAHSKAFFRQETGSFFVADHRSNAVWGLGFRVPKDPLRQPLANLVIAPAVLSFGCKARGGGEPQNYQVHSLVRTHEGLRITPKTLNPEPETRNPKPFQIRPVWAIWFRVYRV